MSVIASVPAVAGIREPVLSRRYQMAAVPSSSLQMQETSTKSASPRIASTGSSRAPLGAGSGPRWLSPNGCT